MTQSLQDQLQKMSVTLLRSMANTRTEVCRMCGATTTARWIEAESQDLFFLGVKKTFVVENARWESDFFDGLCKKCKQANDLEKVKKENQRKIQETVTKAIKIIGGEFAYRNFNFDSYQPKTDSQKEALKIAKSFDPSKDNLMLVGPTGVGKSHLAVAIAMESMLRLLSSQRWRVSELLRHLRVEKSFTDEATKIESLVMCPLLILEDFGAHKETDWGTSILWEIIDRRLELCINGLIVTTNLGRGKMSEMIGDRIPSRLSQLCRVVKIDGPDARVTK